MAGGVQQHQVGPRTRNQAADVGAVEGGGTSGRGGVRRLAGVIPISRTARATHSGIEEV